ncbi:MAG: hypothetical protein ACKO2C_02285 [Actinomycetes bacterium]
MTAPTAVRDRRGDLLAVAVLLLVGGVLPVLVAQRAGALGIPRSDDWSYLTTLFRWTDGGGLRFNGWVSMTLVGQLVLAAPVAILSHRSITAVHVAAATFGVVGLLAVHRIGVRLLPRRSLALLLAVTVGVGPLWMALSPTFMTDVPTFTVQMLMAWAAVVGLTQRDRRIGWFAAAVALGLLGISIRQYAVVPLGAALLAFGLVAVRDRDRRLGLAVVLAAGLAAVTVLALMVWWGTVPDPLPGAPVRPTAGSLREGLARAVGYLRLSGLLLLPVVIACGPVSSARRAWAAGRATTALLTGFVVAGLGAAWLTLGDDVYVGNYVHPRGVLADDVLNGTRPLLMPPALWMATVLVGTVAGLVILWRIVPWLTGLRSRARSVDAVDPVALMLGLTIAGLLGAYVLTDVLQINRFPIFDRYALTMLPLVGLLLLRHPATDTAAAPARRSTSVAVAAGLVALAGYGLVAGIDSATYDATRWRVAEDVVATGVDPRDIAGGFEWLDWHVGRAPRFANTEAERKQIRARTLAPLCVTVSVDPAFSLRAQRVIARRRYPSPLRASVLVVAVRNGNRCGH